MSETSELLASLSDEYWQKLMASEPLFATSLGDRRFDDKLPDITRTGRERIEREYQSILDRTPNLPEEKLLNEEKVTRAALLVDLRSQLDYLSCHLEEWTIDPLGGPQVEFFNIESYQPVRIPAEGSAMVARWLAMAPYLHDHMNNLKLGLVDNRVAVGACLEKAIDEIKDLLAKSDEEWSLLRPLTVPHHDWTEKERMDFQNGLTKAVQDSVRPAFKSYLKFLQTEVLPHARPQERPGIMHLPKGLECYTKLIRLHTSLELSPNELHEIGLREVSRINSEMSDLGRKVLGTSGLKETLTRPRTDPSLYFATRDQVEEKARTALARAKSLIPKWFGRLPKADCVVVRMATHEEKHSTIAYYRQPAADSSRPGEYYINTYAPETRPRYEAEVLAYHESIPGHHLQIAISQELEGIQEFRKYSGVTAFIEGWGLYTERLADEMGLYSSNLDRMGVLSYDAWRACRLVVDTGMHSKNWSRVQAIEFMLENSALAENNIVNEVDRYITWPAQALAYKVGQLEILRLREDAKNRLGHRFDIREFHDILLSNGAVPLTVLGQIIERYVSERLAV
jgi:uncharacterized protein (DUF885 family)